MIQKSERVYWKVVFIYPNDDRHYTTLESEHVFCSKEVAENYGKTVIREHLLSPEGYDNPESFYASEWKFEVLGKTATDKLLNNMRNLKKELMQDMDIVDDAMEKAYSTELL